MSNSLSAKQLSKRWARSQRWVAEQAKAGAIPGAWKAGHLWRFLEADIEAHEMSQAVGSNIFELSDQAQRRRSA